MPDYDLFRHVIAALVVDYGDLDRMLTEQGSGRGGGQVSGSRERSSPLNLHAAELMSEIRYTLELWAELMSGSMAGIRGPEVAVRDDGHALKVNMVRLLSLPSQFVFPTGPEDECREMDGLDACEGFVALRVRTRATVGLAKRWEGLSGWCEGCGSAGLRRDLDAPGQVECQACGQMLAYDSYRRQAMMLLVAETGREI